MPRFDFKKVEGKGYIISGKPTPCSSKTKVLNYILKHWGGISEGYILIEEAKGEEK